ncbi:prepilin-type N-terminal cleavage/methylation domain-containing protein [Mesorhizobium sp. ZC-5]|uniref:prepilin-type N-terminal cleavage/methylation domain-containing protein n=1 Tax=Mesorhizobium sp. ZC-5 TaxID=2986066 RepID=UPI0021E8E167|nr:prepilin-type N-terminal cleavage/methylation domain-containing protein [Mesorhizobium sp. ZC-5]MCV3243110.1 prepilin-type N-terminal cleavage/methylation domain-containing protein [Mesorhizobium sp. ZC-5]
MRCDATGFADRTGEQGFSLLEMMVVLVILATVAALAVPTLRRGGRDKDPEAVAYELQSVFLKARTNAISRGTVETMNLDMEKREVSYAVARQTVAIPNNLTPLLLIGQELIAADGTATLLFFPDGGSSGARIVLADRRNNTAGVVVPWLTGVPTMLKDR